MFSDPSNFRTIRPFGSVGIEADSACSSIAGSPARFEARHGWYMFSVPMFAGRTSPDAPDARAMIRWRREILRWTEHSRIACAGFGMR